MVHSYEPLFHVFCNDIFYETKYSIFLAKKYLNKIVWPISNWLQNVLRLIIIINIIRIIPDNFVGPRRLLEFIELNENDQVRGDHAHELKTKFLRKCAKWCFYCTVIIHKSPKLTSTGLVYILEKIDSRFLMQTIFCFGILSILPSMYK